MIDRIISALEQRLERRRRFKAALAHNREHTFSLSNDSMASTWLCPTCCRVHHLHSTGKFSGPQFDACCEFPAGGRIGKQYATGR